MAKYMAQLNGNLVERILWCSDREAQTQALVDCKNRPVAVGDTYLNGSFFRDGAEVLSEIEVLEQAYLQEISSLVEMIYQMDLEVIN